MDLISHYLNYPPHWQRKALRARFNLDFAVDGNHHNSLLQHGIRKGSALFNSFADSDNSFADSIVDSFANKKNPISFFPPPVKDSDSLKALRARFNLDFVCFDDCA
jgi:hypothetical protein